MFFVVADLAQQDQVFGIDADRDIHYVVLIEPDDVMDFFADGTTSFATTIRLPDLDFSCDLPGVRLIEIMNCFWFLHRQQIAKRLSLAHFPIEPADLHDQHAHSMLDL